LSFEANGRPRIDAALVRVATLPAGTGAFAGTGAGLAGAFAGTLEAFAGAFAGTLEAFVCTFGAEAFGAGLLCTGFLEGAPFLALTIFEGLGRSG
jgi:hypothetical protein